MKRKAIAVLLAMILLLSLTMAIPAFASGSEEPLYLLDEAGILSRDEEAALTGKLEKVSTAYNVQVSVVILESAFGYDIDDLIADLYDTGGFGFGETQDGILLLVCMDKREYCIATNGVATDAISDDALEDIYDAIEADLSDGEYESAFEEFIDQCDYYLNGHFNGFPFEWGKNLLIALVIGLAAGLITAFCLKAQLKSVRPQNQADVYVKSGSMQLTNRSDLYLYRTVSRVKKENNSSSRSGSSRSGSFRSGGGRSF